MMAVIGMFAYEFRVILPLIAKFTSEGIESLSFRAVWTAVDTHRRRLDIYGSERPCGEDSPGRSWDRPIRTAPGATEAPHHSA